MTEPTNDLDMLLTKILGDCLEAYCEDCSKILATGTTMYHTLVTTVAYHHSEEYDHEVHVRSWAD